MVFAIVPRNILNVCFACLCFAYLCGPTLGFKVSKDVTNDGEKIKLDFASELLDFFEHNSDNGTNSTASSLFSIPRVSLVATAALLFNQEVKIYKIFALILFAASIDAKPVDISVACDVLNHMSVPKLTCSEPVAGTVVPSYTLIDLSTCPQGGGQKMWTVSDAVHVFRGFILVDRNMMAIMSGERIDLNDPEAELEASCKDAATGTVFIQVFKYKKLIEVVSSNGPTVFGNLDLASFRRKYAGKYLKMRPEKPFEIVDQVKVTSVPFKPILMKKGSWPVKHYSQGRGFKSHFKPKVRSNQGLCVKYPLLNSVCDGDDINSLYDTYGPKLQPYMFSSKYQRSTSPPGEFTVFLNYDDNTFLDLQQQEVLTGYSINATYSHYVSTFYSKANTLNVSDWGEVFLWNAGQRSTSIPNGFLPLSRESLGGVQQHWISFDNGFSAKVGLTDFRLSDSGLYCEHDISVAFYNMFKAQNDDMHCKSLSSSFVECSYKGVNICKVSSFGGTIGNRYLNVSKLGYLTRALKNYDYWKPFSAPYFDLATAAYHEAFMSENYNGSYNYTSLSTVHFTFIGWVALVLYTPVIFYWLVAILGYNLYVLMRRSCINKFSLYSIIYGVNAVGVEVGPLTVYRAPEWVVAAAAKFHGYNITTTRIYMGNPRRWLYRAFSMTDFVIQAIVMFTFPIWILTVFGPLVAFLVNLRFVYAQKASVAEMYKFVYRTYKREYPSKHEVEKFATKWSLVKADVEREAHVLNINIGKQLGDVRLDGIMDVSFYVVAAAILVLMKDAAMHGKYGKFTTPNTDAENSRKAQDSVVKLLDVLKGGRKGESIHQLRSCKGDVLYKRVISTLGASLSVNQGKFAI